MVTECLYWEMNSVADCSPPHPWSPGRTETRCGGLLATPPTVTREDRDNTLDPCGPQWGGKSLWPTWDMYDLLFGNHWGPIWAHSGSVQGKNLCQGSRGRSRYLCQGSRGRSRYLCWLQATLKIHSLQGLATDQRRGLPGGGDGAAANLLVPGWARDLITPPTRCHGHGPRDVERPNSPSSTSGACTGLGVRDVRQIKMADKDYSCEHLKESMNKNKPQTSGCKKKLCTEVDLREESCSLMDEVMATSDFEDSTLDFSDKPSNCSLGADSSVEGICERTKQLVNEINKSRMKDHKWMSNFKDTLIMKISEFSKKIEEQLFEIYNSENKLIEDTLQELLNILDRIRCLDSELKQSCNAMATVYKDMCSQPEV
ncbi:synaptonemal complex central element protein 2 [Narcine bancroftii]|uniref:synaptonemal complex central element protein 2 n=1 Tax=Narcine bancroftii TaxID=1343680 RepID=UPI0038311CBD